MLPSNLYVSQMKLVWLIWILPDRYYHRGRFSPYLCWLFWSPHTKQAKITACLAVRNQSWALMWSLGSQRGWGEWEGREARESSLGRETARQKKRSTADEGEQTEEKFPRTPGRPRRGTKRASVLVKMCGRHPGSVCGDLDGFPSFESFSFNQGCWASATRGHF